MPGAAPPVVGSAYATIGDEPPSCDLEQAKALPNLPWHPAPNEDVFVATYQGGEQEAPKPGTAGQQA